MGFHPPQYADVRLHSSHVGFYITLMIIENTAIAISSTAL